MPPKIPAPPSLAFIRTHSDTSNRPQSTSFSAAKKVPEDESTKRFISNRRALITLITNGTKEEYAIKDEQVREFQAILDAFEKIRGPRPRVFIKKSDNPRHWNQDTLHTYYLTAILNSNWDDFSSLLRQAREIGTATHYSPSYKKNELLITAIQRAIAYKDSTRNPFVTQLLLLRTVQSELNQDKATYDRILNLLFMAADRPHVVTLREAIRTSTTNAQFKRLFRYLERELSQRKISFLEKQHPLEMELTSLQASICSDEHNQFQSILLQEKMSRSTVHAIEEINALRLMAIKQHALLLAEEKSQHDALFTQEAAQLIAAKKIELPLLEAQQRLALYSKEGHRRDDILSQASTKPVTNKRLTSDQITLNALGALCKNYLDYVCETLKCNPSTVKIKKPTDSNKRLDLIKKFEFVESLYNITQCKERDSKSILKAFKTQFSQPTHQALLQSHRDQVFLRFMLSLWNILKLIPNLLSAKKTPSSFWKPAKGKILSDALMVTMNGFI
jgi:hypothetical protein